MDVITIEKNINNLKKVKSVLKGKIDKVDLQIAKMKTLLAKEKEKEKLKHIKSQKTFFKN